jgi:hypothetical protein
LSPQRNEKKKIKVKRNFVQPSLYDLSPPHRQTPIIPTTSRGIPFAKAQRRKEGAQVKKMTTLFSQSPTNPKEISPHATSITITVALSK